MSRLRALQQQYPHAISDVRGKGLLIAMELDGPDLTKNIKQTCLEQGLLVNVTQGTIIRIFPALTITRDEAEEGLKILNSAVATCL